MNMICIWAVTIGALLLRTFLVRRGMNPNREAVVLKALCSFCFVLTAALATWGAEAHYLVGALLIAGLALGMLGDVWLDLKYVYPADGDFWTYMGFCVFLFGHLFYIGAVIALVGVSGLTFGLAALGAVLAVLFVHVGEKPMGLHYGEFKTISAIYAAVLFFDTVFILASAVQTGNAGLVIMGAGAAFFLLSDLILSGTYFGTGKDKSVHITLNHLLYYVGQYMIAMAILWM